MSYIFTSLAVLFLIVAGGSVAYLTAILLAAAVAKREMRRTRPVDGGNGKLPRIGVVIPAHNESLVIASTLESVLGQTYDRELYEIVVVADNCTDDTARIARRMGVTVLDRTDPDLRGKGHALNWAIARLLDIGSPLSSEERAISGEGLRGEGAPGLGVRVSPTPFPGDGRSEVSPFDAFVIVDADTRVAPDFLAVMAERIAARADSRGYCALQGRYGVLNAAEGWRAGLMAGAFELFNHVRPLGRNRLGLTVGLKGNGMAFSRQLLCDARWSGSVTEDIDFALDLCRRYNLRVQYVPEARVEAQMPTTASAAASQRSRWESGRFQLMRERALPMLVEGIRRRNRLMIDAGIDVMIPPLADLAGLMLVWAVIAGCGDVTGKLPHAMAWIDAVSVTAIVLFAYILGGFAVAGASASAYTALVFAPFYAVWKICLYASRAHRQRAAGGEWIRTARAPVDGPSTEPKEIRPAFPMLKGSEVE